MLRTGTILKTRYCILDQLGKGGQGSVYLARDIQLGILWAIKEIPLSKKREAKLQLLFRHVSLPKMIDYFEKGDNCYLVMEYIEGHTLQEILDSNAELSIDQIFSIAVQMTEICEYLHGFQPPICHGDLKPGNIMLTESDRIYLIDFGAAMKTYDDRKRRVEGTKGFAAPEQYEGRLNEKSDIYGLARTLLTLLYKKQKKHMWKNPAFLWTLFRCSRKQESMRLENMRLFREKIKQDQKQAHVDLTKGILVISLFLALGVLYLSLNVGPKVTFEEMLTEITAPCYADDFIEKSQDEQKTVYENMEKSLQKMTKRYTAREETQRLFLLLALNSELCEESHRAASYYEQLLFYEDGCEVVYGEYGSFLLRAGQKDASDLLYQIYRNELQRGKMKDSLDKNFLLWKDYYPDIPEIVKQGFDMEMGGFDLTIGTEEYHDDWTKQENLWSEEELYESAERNQILEEIENDTIETGTEDRIEDKTEIQKDEQQESLVQISAKITAEPETTIAGAKIQNNRYHINGTEISDSLDNSSSSVLSNVSVNTKTTSTSTVTPKPTITSMPTQTPKTTFTPVPSDIPYTTIYPPVSITPSISVKPSDIPTPTQTLIPDFQNKGKKKYLLPSNYVPEIMNERLVFQRQDFIIENVREKQEKVLLSWNTEMPVHIWGIRINDQEVCWNYEEENIYLDLSSYVGDCSIIVLYACEQAVDEMFTLRM